ncbi:GNAT family N-acetyltransferase [Acidicapsa ligni]|uniref:GNAT family N-acetyltransferase n=1 Tax=Acidicapsa ligni TaxID=542300 RepID=UPI0021E0AE1D|nr:GNAT family N-acetyltransferase [Acidicapsa ligni]
MSLIRMGNVCNPHPLDQPIWNALRTEHHSVALGNHLAQRYPAAIGPLSGIANQDHDSYEALRTLAGPGGVVALFLEEEPIVPPGWKMIRGGHLNQMILQPDASLNWTESTELEGIRQLNPGDVPAMVELATLTEPGPFAERTIELGNFFGFFEDGRLLAMAGQRMHLPDYVEVSAVCTHPDGRRRGLARILMIKAMQDILQRGKTPFLHAFSTNSDAIRVYRDLGFTLRQTFNLSVLKNDL